MRKAAMKFVIDYRFSWLFFCCSNFDIFWYVFDRCPKNSKKNYIMVT